MATDIQLHKQQAQELSNKLWAIANDLRGTRQVFPRQPWLHNSSRI